MSTVRLVRHSLRTMNRYKLRTGFMMLGSLIGVTALTLVVSVGQAFEGKMLTMFGRLFGDSAIMISDGGGRMMGGPHQPQPGTRLKVDDIDAIAKELPGVQAWDPQQQVSGLDLKHGSATDSAASIQGDSERGAEVGGRGLTEGEYFGTTAILGSARVAVIGETVVRELYPDQDPIGAALQIGSVPFRVIGILEPWGTNPHGMDQDNVVVVPITTLMRRLTNVDTISTAKLIMSDPSQASQLSERIRRILRARHALVAGQPDDFTILTPIEVQKEIGNIKRVLFLYLPLVASITLLIGGIVAASLMLASVNERVGEIGLRRAVGARPGDIRLQFLIETAATTLVGGLTGIALGYLGARMGASKMHLENILVWNAAFLGIAASTLTGLLAGLAPALRAARLNPADALR
jgi:putative ABC transport system permease protein